MSGLVAFIDIFVESPLMDDVIHELQRLPNLEELYEVAGDYDIISIFFARDIDEFRDILVNGVMKIKGVRSTVTSVILHSYKGSELVGRAQAGSGVPKQ
jgi:DNA-binding Lrp family transcriptional regulator